MTRFASCRDRCNRARVRSRLPQRPGRPENKKLQIVGTKHFKPHRSQHVAQIGRLKAPIRRLLLTGTVALRWARSCADPRLGLDIPIVAVNGNILYQEMGQFASIMPKELDFPSYRAMIEGDVAPGPIQDAQRVFFRALKGAKLETRGTQAIRDGLGPLMIVLSAYAHLGRIRPRQQIHEYIENLHGFAGVNGLYDFRDAGQRAIGAQAIVVDRWDPAARLSSF